MKLVCTKMCVRLLCGVILLFFVESMTTSIPGTRSARVTVLPNDTGRQPITEPVTELQHATGEPVHGSLEGITGAGANTALPVEITDKSNNNNRKNGRAASSPPSPPASTAEAQNKAQPPPTASTAPGGDQPPPTATKAPGGDQLSPTGTTAPGGDQLSPTGTTAPGGDQPPPTASTAPGGDQPPPTATKAPGGDQLSSTGTTAPGGDQLSPTASTAPGGDQPPFTEITTAEEAKQTTDRSHQTSPPFTATESVSSLATSTARLRSTPELPATTSSENTQMTSSRPQSPTPPTGTVQVNITSGAAPVSGATETETPTRAELSPKSHLTSTSPEFTSQFPSSASTDSTISTSLAGILNPREPKRGSVSTPKPGPATSAAPTEGPKTPPSNEVQPCSNRGVVRQCLVVIGALAALATAFMVSTIVLCARLSARKPNARRPQQMTEMMCISSLLPERNHNYTRQRNPITNGVLVFPAAGDSDEDGGDNLTLSSFLPENERYV